MARERSATPGSSPTSRTPLHMPGHIYAQSDRIQEAISAFSAAAANEQKWIASDSLYPTGHHGHNVHFLIHALNLGGRYDDSMKWVQHLLHVQGKPARAQRQQPARPSGARATSG